MGAETLTLVLGPDGGAVEAMVEEWHPLEPSAYVWEPGWTCLVGETEYFVSEAGVVYEQPENVVVGSAPKLVALADEIERGIPDEA